MAIEFIGSLQNTSPLASAASGRRGSSGLAEDPTYPARMARIHEEAGFDRVLVSHSAGSPDGVVIAGQVLGATTTLGVLLAHRPGLVAPTVLARQCATLDACYPGGRVALHCITGGDDRDLARDGDFLEKPSRYRRSDEFLDVVEREWSSDEPFDYEGDFYRVAGGMSSIRPADGHLPVYFAGASADAVPVGARHADVYAFWGEPLAAVAERMAGVRAAARHGRTPRFSVSLRPIPAETEEEAWERAHRILQVEQHKSSLGRDSSGAEGSARLRRFAAEAEVHDKRLWMPLATVPNAFGNATALVGSYEQVAEALLDYVAIGVTTLLINGYEPERDAADSARIISLVREQAAATPVGA